MRNVILDGMRKVILNVDTYPWKWLNMSFLHSIQDICWQLLFFLSFFFFGGGVFEPFHYFSNPVFTRMVHLLISGTETMLRYILWRQSTLLLTTTKKWHEMAIYAVLLQNQLWQIWDMPEFFLYFLAPLKLTHLSNFNVSFTFSCD